MQPPLQCRSNCFAVCLEEGTHDIYFPYIQFTHAYSCECTFAHMIYVCNHHTYISNWHYIVPVFIYHFRHKILHTHALFWNSKLAMLWIHASKYTQNHALIQNWRWCEFTRQNTRKTMRTHRHWYTDPDTKVHVCGMVYACVHVYPHEMLPSASA